MNEQIQEWIQALEIEWSQPDGFLGKVRGGIFDRQQEVNFIATLQKIKLPDGEMISKRLVALLWYIPVFLRWQTERVIEVGGDAIAYEHFTNQVQAAIEDILGIP